MGLQEPRQTQREARALEMTRSDGVGLQGKANLAETTLEPFVLKGFGSSSLSR